MPKEMIINVGAEGVVSGLHFDEFSLGFLGDMKIGRASEIFFNEENQNWDVKVPGQDAPHKQTMGFESYEQAREFEVRWLQGCMKGSIDPKSPTAADYATTVRYMVEEGDEILATVEADNAQGIEEHEKKAIRGTPGTKEERESGY